MSKPNPPPVRHVVITGAGTGIGKAIALALAEQGFRLSLLGRRMEPLEAVADASGGAPISCDVTDPAAVASAIAEAEAHHGAVDILINCAGAAPTLPFHKLTIDDWRKVFAVNVEGVFNCTQAVLPGMRERKWGRIINIASTAALRGYAYVSAYTAAKHAVLGLTRALALETARLNITVNAICPGYTDTDIVRDAIAGLVEKTGKSEPEVLAQFTASNPQGRLVDPAEVADSVVWLCRDESASITGQAISISGGETM